MLSQPALPGAGLFLLAILSATAAVFDIFRRRIPNWLVLAGIAVGVAWNSYSSGIAGLGRSAEGLGLGFILYFPLYLLRARGAGDVKLLASIGALTGPAICLWIFFLTAIMGGLIALALVICRGRLRHTLFNTAWILRDLTRLQAPYLSSPELDVTTRQGIRLPHAVMIAVGSFGFIVMSVKS